MTANEYNEKIRLIISEHPYKKTTDHEMCAQIERLAMDFGYEKGYIAGIETMAEESKKILLVRALETKSKLELIRGFR